MWRCRRWRCLIDWGDRCAWDVPGRGGRAEWASRSANEVNRQRSAPAVGKTNNVVGG